MKRLTKVAVAACLIAPTPLVAAPARDADLVMDCYVVQSNGLSLGQFVRHLEVHQDRGVVTIADSVRGAAPRFIGNGQLVTLDAERLIYDFASSSSAGRTEIDRRTGDFLYSDGRAIIRGTCQQSAL